MTRVFVTRCLPGGDGPGSPLSRLQEALGGDAIDLWVDDLPPPVEVVRKRGARCDGLLTMLTERVDEALLGSAPSLRVIANLAVGYDNIDVPACTRHGVLVTNTPGVLTDTTADMTWALLLAGARRIFEGRQAIEEGTWGPWHPTWLLGHEVTGRTLGIVGPGRIGAAVARRARGFDMTVLYSGRSPRPEFPGEHVPLDTLLARSDYVSMHVPLTEETRGMCDAAFFRRMQPHAIFVNTSRGGVVDQAALIDALQAETIGGAALDVMTPEPLPADDPLLRAPRLVLAPHLGSSTNETRTRMAHLAVDGLLAGLQGNCPSNAVNPEALQASTER